MSYLEGLAKNEKRKMIIPAIETNIILDFCRNLERRDNYICSEAEYKGVRAVIVFYSMSQFSEALNKLANYLYKIKGD